MRLFPLVVIVAVYTLVLALASDTKFCRYWCRLDHDHEHFYYCCPSSETSERWLTKSMWPIMSSPMFWLGVLGTTIGVHAAQRHHSHEADWETRTKKNCPPVRSACPRSFDGYEAPNWCATDDECGHSEKCCYDICLDHKTCKPAE